MGVGSPSLTAVKTLLAAQKATIAIVILGKGKDTDLSLGQGLFAPYIDVELYHYHLMLW